MTTEQDLYRVRDWEEKAMARHVKDWKDLAQGCRWALGLTAVLGAVAWLVLR